MTETDQPNPGRPDPTPPAGAPVGPAPVGPTRPARRKWRSGWLALIIPLVLILLLVAFWNWDWFRPLVEAQASAALGRPVTLARFDLKPGRQTVAIADGVRIANPAGFPESTPFASIGQLRITVDLWDYLRTRQLVIPSIVVDHPDIAAEQPEGKAPNWNFPALAAKPGAPAQPADAGPKIGDLEIDDGVATVKAPSMRADFTLRIATSAPADDGERKITVDAKGTYAGQPITGRAIGGALLSLRDTASPYPIDLQVANGPTRVSLVGTVQDPLAFAGANLKLRFSGPDMSLLYPLTSIPIPRTPPYTITGNLDYADRRIVFRDFAGKVGSSDLEGRIAVDPHGARPDVTADLSSHLVDLADLGGFIGSQPGRMSTPGQTPQEKQQLAKAEASPRLLPDKPIDMPELRSADIHLKYDGARILGKSVPFDSISVVMNIVDGRIQLTPISMGIGQGKLSGMIDLQPIGGPDGRQIRLRSDIGMQRVDLRRLIQTTGVADGSGIVGGHAVIDSTGNSVATFAGNSDGSVQLVMDGGGDLSALLVDLSGFEFGNSLLSALGIPNREQIECFVGDFGLRNGLLTTRTFQLDTNANVVNGTGSANLRDEMLDFHVKTEAKHFSIGTLPTPIAITGTFKHPSIRPEILPLAARGGIAAALGVLFPPAALLPMIQLGVGDNGRCAAQARRDGTPVK